MANEIRKLNTSVFRLGFWSALLVTLSFIVFTIAFASYAPSLPAKWQGIDAFAATFQPLPYLAWVLPSLCLALTLPIMMSCIHFSTTNEQRLWSWMGVLFAAMYGAVMATNYWVLATVVREGLMNGPTEALAPFVIGSPHSITNSIEWVGYGFLGLSTFFVGFSFAGGRLEQWIRVLFVVTGVAVLADILLGSAVSVALTQIPLVVASIAFPLATALVAIRFRRCARVAVPDL